MKTYTFQPRGVCSREIQVDLDDQGVIQSLRVTGGCSGNLQGISRLVEGMGVQDAIEKLQGIQCGWKPTSCPDQLSKALTAALAESK